MAKRSKTHSPRPKGHDFGIETRAALVNSPEFLQHLSEAEISACIYGFNRCEVLNTVLPMVALVGAKEEPLAAAFREFHRWSQESGNDAVDLTFVFLKDGGYALGVGASHASIQRRLGRGVDVEEALSVSGTWIKKFDTRSPEVVSLRQRHSGALVAPFLFAGVTHPAIRSPADLDVSLVKRLPGVLDLLKFYATFVDEEAVQDHTLEMLVLRGGKGRPHEAAASGRTPPLPPKDSDPKGFFRRRQRALERHFPVTLERLRSLGLYRDVLTQAEALGIRRWQTEQAICNIILSVGITPPALHYEPIRQGRLNREVNEALARRFEEADGIDPLQGRLHLDALVEQATLDVSALLIANGRPLGSSRLDDLQGGLANAGLRDLPHD